MWSADCVCGVALGIRMTRLRKRIGLRHMMRWGSVVFSMALAAALGSGAAASAQDLPLTQVLKPSKISPIDPTRGMTKHDLESSRHTPLPEEYIWTASGADASDKVLYTRPSAMERIEPHYFRRAFQVSSVPAQATLYIAGPRSVKVWLNGQVADEVQSDITSPLGMHVYATDVKRFLKPGVNTIAIEAMRGRGVSGFANS